MWIHIIFTLSLETQTREFKTGNFDREYVIEIINFFEFWAKKKPKNFPKITAHFLTSLVQKIHEKILKQTKLSYQTLNYSEICKKNNLKVNLRNISKKIISIFCELTKSNFDLCYECQAVSVLFDISVDLYSEDDEGIFNKVTNCLIDLLDEENSRKVIMKNFSLGKMLSRLFEISPNLTKNDKMQNPEIDIVINVTKFLQKILQNTSGLFFLLRNQIPL